MAIVLERLVGSGRVYAMDITRPSLTITQKYAEPGCRPFGHTSASWSAPPECGTGDRTIHPAWLHRPRTEFALREALWAFLQTKLHGADEKMGMSIGTGGAGESAAGPSWRYD